jgi:CheY-like chemotaxis protein
MILLVEDQPLLAMLAQCTLEEAGYEVTLATGGQQALERLDRGLRPTALFTDIRLVKA